MSRNEDNVMYVYLASITSLSSGPLEKCKQHSTHLQTAVSCQVNTATYCVHSNIQITGTILTANTTTDALQLQTFEMSNGFLTVRRWGQPDTANVTDMLILFPKKENMKFYCYKWFVCMCPKVGQHWKTLLWCENYYNDWQCLLP